MTPPPGSPTAAPAPPPGAPRSLAEDLRARSDEELAALLAARPELATPAPHDITSLAARASTRVSVQRTLDHLTTPQLQVLEVVVALGGAVGTAQLAEACGATAADVAPVAERLRELALVWGDPSALMSLRAVAESLGPAPAGLGPPLVEALGVRSPVRTAELVADLGLPPAGDPVASLRAVAGLLGDPERLQGVLADAPPQALALLEQLTWGPPVGVVEHADRQVSTADARTPLEWLLARGVLAASGPTAVVLPREVAIALRGGRVAAGLRTAPPAPETTARPPAAVDAGAASAAAELVRLVHELLRSWSSAPPPVLRAGGLGVRELRRTAVHLDVTPEQAAFVVELARAAGLVADDAEADPAWAPTPASDAWLDLDTARRWGLLAESWLATSRVPALVGQKDERGSTRNALADDLDRTAAPLLRRAALVRLAELPPGAAASPDDVLAALRWSLPRRTGGLGPVLVRSALVEAGQLGVVALGALTGAGRMLLEGRVEEACAALASALPEPVTAVLLQADLTAVAPGPLVGAVADQLELMADVDSRGGATVYRFSPASVRRAMDVGRTAEDVLAFLAEHSTTPVPQPLEYLVTDVARRHGRVRVGLAGAYLRSDDEAALAGLLVDPRAAPLRLRRLAPTVVAAQADPTAVLSVLRTMGLAPAVEGADADVVLRPPPRRRAPDRARPRPVTGEPPVVTPQRATALVGALRSGEGRTPATAADPRAGGTRAPGAGAPLAARPGGRPPVLPALEPTTALAVLREAVTHHHPVWLAVTDHAGTTTRAVQPLSVEGGAVIAVDAETGGVVRTSVHRVSGVAPVA